MGDPPARFGGRGAENQPSLPLSELSVQGDHDSGLILEPRQGVSIPAMVNQTGLVICPRWTGASPHQSQANLVLPGTGTGGMVSGPNS